VTVRPSISSHRRLPLQPHLCYVLPLTDEDDWCAAMATVSSVLHQAFEYYHWTGFYRTAGTQELTAASCSTLKGLPQQSTPTSAATSSSSQQPQLQLVVGPYQGSLGCLRIPYDKGVCGAAARTRTTQLVPDVHTFPGHIACASRWVL
jgi:GAF domain-containing protein